MNRSNLYSIILFTFFVFCSSCKEEILADLIITNATIWTANDQAPYAEAMAIEGERILAIGSNESIEKFKSVTTKTIDAKGQMVTPGFIDSHVHFLTGGFNLASVQLRDADTKEEFINRIAEFAKTQEPGTWIQGGDWDHENWGGELPTKEWIDKHTPDNPVWITRLDGHMSLANSLALELAGIDNSIGDIVGGTIIRDGKGKLTGVFKDNAMGAVSQAIPNPTPSQIDDALKAAMDYVASNGVTSVHHMSGYMDALKRARNNNSLITRIYASMPLSQWEALESKVNMEGRGDHWLKIGGLKGFVDGSLGSHTAAFFEPFTDAPNDKGFFVVDEKTLHERISGADKAGLQVMVHAIGDSAINTLLNIYEDVETENGSKDRRFRIEHAQHIGASDINRFKDLSVIASMQPYHAIDDGRWAEKVIGPERINTTYAFNSLIAANATVAFGSDWFVAPPIPLDGLYAAVTRMTLDDANPNGWVPAQKISLEYALRSYTINAAYASFEENIKGSLEVGKLADFVIIDQNLFEMEPKNLRNAKIIETYVGGKSVFKIK
jgi:predicted amidohydrolase YtcJ